MTTSRKVKDKNQITGYPKGTSKSIINGMPVTTSKKVIKSP
jgi:hypothetical protein